MFPYTFTILFAIFLCLSVMLKWWLASRQIQHVTKHRNQVPEAFAGVVSVRAHQKAADYTVAKARFSLLTTAFGSITLLAWTLLGGLDAFNGWLQEAGLSNWGPMAYQLSLMLGFMLLSGLLDLPFQIYSTFHIEQKFGFNRMTWRLWVSDTFKNIVVSTFLGLPLLALVLWLMGQAGSWWWLWAWGSWAAFSFLMMLIYPLFIAPWFNRFEPLADESLRARVESLMQRCGFASQGLFVMDGSKRSAHANAYFTGFGAARRVVFFDTLLKKLKPEEIEAVLAHELGHFKCRHTLQRLLATLSLSGMALALLGWLHGKTWFYQGLGVQPSVNAPNEALALLLFMLTVPLLHDFIAPLFAWASRKHEFEADAFASQQASAKALSGALIRLYEDNAATLTPDPLYARFYSSHPPAIERIAALQLTQSA